MSLIPSTTAAVVALPDHGENKVDAYGGEVYSNISSTRSSTTVSSLLILPGDAERSFERDGDDAADDLSSVTSASTVSRAIDNVVTGSGRGISRTMAVGTKSSLPQSSIITRKTRLASHHHHHVEGHIVGDSYASSFTGQSKASFDTSSIRILCIDDKSLCGREAEILFLQQAFDRTRLEYDKDTGRTSFELILLEAPAGAGKSSLVEHSLRNYASERGATLAIGKYDQLRARADRTSRTGDGPAGIHQEDSSPTALVAVSRDNNNNLNSVSTATGLPFPGIVLALQDLCDVLPLRTDQTSLRKKLRQNFDDSDLQMLCSLMPSLWTFLGDSFNDSMAWSSDREGKQKRERQDDPIPFGRRVNSMATTTTQFKRLCRRFLYSVSTSIHPTVLFLDDIHWADQESLHFILSLLSSSSADASALQHCLLIASFRNEEEHQTCLLGQFLDEVHRYSDETARVRIRKDPDDRSRTKTYEDTSISVPRHTIHRLALSNLDEAAVLDILLRTLHTATAETKELAKVFMEKTLGSAFSVVQFFELLQIEGYLYRRVASDLDHHHQYPENVVWQWNIDEIQKGMTVSGNVAIILSQKIDHRLDPNQVQVLEQASCLGHTFDSKLLTLVVESLSKKGSKSKEDDSNRALIAAEKAGLIVKHQSNEGHFCFAHDIIQSCLYDRIGDEDAKNRRHSLIGKAMLKNILANAVPITTGSSSTAVANSLKEAADPLVFEAADQLNRGMQFVAGVNEKKGLILLNMEAGRRAARQGMAAAAVAYLRLATNLVHGDDVPGSGWTTNYALTLQVYNESAEYEALAGNFEAVENRVTQVLHNTKTLDDKLVALSVKADSLGNQGRLEEALDHSLKVLKDLGVLVSKPRKLHILLGIQRIRRRINGLTDDEILNYPPCTKRRHLITTLFFKRCLGHVLLLSKGDYYAILVVKAVDHMLQHGFSEASITSLVSLGVVLSALHRIDEAIRVARLCFTITRSSNVSNENIVVSFFAAGNILHWREPMKNLTPIMLNTWHRGLQLGEFSYCSIAGASFIVTRFLFGGRARYPQSASQAEAMLKTMRQHKQERNIILALPAYQAILNMMNMSDDPLVLTGDAMDEVQLLAKVTELQNVAAKLLIQAMRMYLACFFQRWDVAHYWKEQCESNNSALSSLRSHYSVLTFAFFLGYISCVFIIDGKGQRKHHRQLTESLRTLKHWLKDGKKDSRNFLYLLEAENMVRQLKPGVVSGSKRMIETTYRKAIQAADEDGFLMMQAFANERLAIHLKNRYGDERLAATYMSEAHGLYWEIGAVAKCEQLEHNHGVLLRDASVDVACPIATIEVAQQ